VKTQFQSRTAGEYRADLQNLRTTCKLKLPQLTEGRADQAAAMKDRRKNHYPTTRIDYGRASA
jgi:hypothetical protein